MLILPAFPVRQRTVLHRWLRFPFFYQPVLQKGIRCAILNRNRPAAESRLPGTEVRMKNSGEEYRLHELLPLGVTAPRVYAAVDRAALAHNYRLLVRRAESVAGHPTVPISVVKADAYGHGVKRCVCGGSHRPAARAGGSRRRECRIFRHVPCRQSDSDSWIYRPGLRPASGQVSVDCHAGFGGACPSDVRGCACSRCSRSGAHCVGYRHEPHRVGGALRG